MIFLVDSHCHLDMLDETPTDGVVMRARENGVRFMLNVCVNLKDFPAVLRIAETYPDVAASVGLHPNDQEEEVDEQTLVSFAKHPKVVAIGETGLDYFRSSGDLTWQHNRFRAHVRAAKATHKPLIIHTRDAKEDTLRIMKQENAAEAGGVMHCFTESWETAQQALDMGFYISLSGIVTFKNAAAVQAVAKQVPLDRLLVETDSPYLAPNPYRGKPNEPAYVRYTAEFIAGLRGISLEALAVQTTDNFFTLFKEAVRPHV